MALNFSMPAREIPTDQDPERYEGKNSFNKHFTGEIFTLGCFDDMVRVQVGQHDPRDLPPCRCYALRPQNQPLLEESIWNDGSMPSLVYRNFRWCGVRTKIITLHNDRYYIPGYLPENKNTYPDRLFFINFMFDEEVYVADLNAGKEYFARVSAMNRQTNKSKFDLEESYRVAARTIIPISQYQGQFNEPTILIGRELLFDEVKYIKSFKRQ